MGLKEIIKNNKIPESHIPRVLKILDHAVDSFYYSCVRFKRDFDDLRNMHLPERVFINENNSTELYLLQTRLYVISLELIHGYEKDLYEFFYGKEKPEEEEYFYYQFPLDKKRFERERIKEEDMKKAMEDKGNFDEIMYNYIKHNVQLFYKCLKIKK